MVRSLLPLAAMLVAITCCPYAAYAAVHNITLYPDSPGIDVSGIAGNTSNSAPGFGSQSWQLAGNGKGEVYIPAALLFSGPVTINDIRSISYSTNKPGNGGDVDWALYIYTMPTGDGDSSGWYKSRLNAEPYFTSSTVAPNTWNEWSTGGSNPLKFYDQPRSGNYGTYSDPTLSDLQNSTSYNGRDYGVEEILLISLQTGSGWSNGFTGLVDGLTIELTNGDVYSINLEAEPTPEPASLAIWGGIGMVGLIAARRRRKLAARNES